MFSGRMLNIILTRTREEVHMADAKVILIMIDALGYETAWARCGYLGHLVEQKKGALYRVKGELPAQSRPMYETMMTGLAVGEHGICANEMVCPSKCENLFSLAKKNGKTTGAAAYMWIAELYNGIPGYCPLTDRYQLGNTAGLIGNGIFYSQDDYPDSHLYADGDFLRKAYHPDFLLIHPMNVDDQGHKHGWGSREYEHAAEVSINIIDCYLDLWRRDGYDVVVTADHGMDELGNHFGDTRLQREVPLFVFSAQVQPGNYGDHTVSQLNVAPLICRLMGIEPSGLMMDPSEEIRW